jgi:hypothetical protein
VAVKFGHWNLIRLEAAGMIFMRHIAGYTLLHHKRSDDILKELK